MLRAWRSTYSTGPSTTSRPLARMFRISSKKGQPCCTFQITFGRKTRKARPPPSQIHGRAKARRCGLSRTPTTRAKAKTAIEYLFCRPSPAIAPNDEPQPLVAGLDDPHDHVRAPRPEQRLERVHREEVVHHDVDEGEGARQGGEAHREASAAHLARQEARQQDERRSGEGRGEPHREERGAERVADEPRHRGDERRLVHVAPVEVLAAGQEVQLVAEVPVAGGGREVQQQLRRRDREDDGQPAGEPRPRARHRSVIRHDGQPVQPTRPQATAGPWAGTRVLEGSTLVSRSCATAAGSELLLPMAQDDDSHRSAER